VTNVRAYSTDFFSDIHRKLRKLKLKLKLKLNLNLNLKPKIKVKTYVLFHPRYSSFGRYTWTMWIHS